jgi:hypothetical protein
VVEAGYRAKTEIYTVNQMHSEHKSSIMILQKMLGPTIKKIIIEGLGNYVKLLSLPDSFMNTHLNLCVNYVLMLY